MGLETIPKALLGEATHRVEAADFSSMIIMQYKEEN